MNYNYLKYFYIVGKLKNISKAASYLEVTQPAVSRIISNLEEECKTKLFERYKNGVIFTKEGQNLYNLIENPFLELEKLEETIKSGEALQETIINIGATATSLSCYLFKHLEELKNKYPTINFKIHTDSSSNLLKLVKKGVVDFAFITTPFEDDDELETCPVQRLEHDLIAPTSYKNKLKGKVSIKDLEDYPFILLGKDMQFREHVDNYLKENNIKINPAYETDTSGILISFVEHGCGLTFLPCEMAKESLKNGTCFKVDLIEKIPNRYVTFIIKKDRKHSSVVEEIKKAIIERRY